MTECLDCPRYRMKSTTFTERLDEVRLLLFRDLIDKMKLQSRNADKDTSVYKEEHEKARKNYNEICKLINMARNPNSEPPDTRNEIILNLIYGPTVCRNCYRFVF